MSDDRRPDCGDTPLYVLGLLDSEQARRFLDHAADCVVCRDEIAALTPVVDSLPDAVASQPAPRALRARVMNEVRREARVSRALARERERGDRLAGRLRGFALAGAAASLLGAGIAFGAVVLGGTSSPSARTVHVQVSAPGASASLRREGARAWLRYADMPGPGRGRVYEIWVQREGGGPPQPTTALFTPDAAGGGRVSVPGGISGVQAVMVTSEPAGGSLSPSRAPVIVARIG